MQFIVLSRQFSESSLVVRDKCQEPYVWISIRDLDKSFVKPPVDPLRKAVLNVAFDDTEKIDEKFLDRTLKPISDKQAMRIVEFVTAWKDKVNLCLVNCEAGISRSSGTALALSMLLNGHDSDILGTPRFAPNMLVKDKIVEHGEALANDNTPYWFRSRWDENRENARGTATEGTENPQP